ncbi:MAG TPA: hypothetical protein VGR26_00885 [Acidimicrobiales bacterium]|nr:hypothetical protein [Acidimicrobiales bacterium]
MFGVFVVVAVLAIYLIIIALVLRDVSFTLGTIIIGVRAIVNQTNPVPMYVGTILSDVVAIDQAADQLLSWGKPTVGTGADRPMLTR